MSKGQLSLHTMIQNSAQSAKVIAITSGKGGVGKTNIAANLAICLSAGGKRTLLMDADICLSNLDIVMGINSKYNISHFINGQKRIEEITQIGPEGVEIICGGSGLEQLADISDFQQQRLLRELTGLGDKNDVIVIDTAAGLSKSVVGFCLSADQVLVVTTPEPAAITDAYAMIKVLCLKKYSGRISLIVNMAQTIAEGKKTYRQISNVAKRFLDRNIYEAGVILRDEQLTSAVREQKPVVLFYPRSKASLQIIALAAKLSSNCAARQGNQGFFRKVVNWFS